MIGPIAARFHFSLSIRFDEAMVRVLQPELVVSEFDALSSNILTTFRKAIAHLDEELNLPSVQVLAPPAPAAVGSG